jgi:hypothetical protein
MKIELLSLIAKYQDHRTFSYNVPYTEYTLFSTSKHPDKKYESRES